MSRLICLILGHKPLETGYATVDLCARCNTQLFKNDRLDKLGRKILRQKEVRKLTRAERMMLDRRAK